MKRILITGASGFVGSFLVEHGLELGYEVTAGIRASSSRRYLRDERIRMAVLDLSRTQVLTEQLRSLGRFDYLVHNAGLTRALDGADFDRVNHQYTRNLADALRASGNMPDKFIFISSLAAFGPGNPDSMEPIRLTDTPHPDTLYGKSKLRAEQYLMSLPELPWLILRPTGVYGPRETDYFLFLKSVQQGIEFRMGRKPQMLTFIYVRDLVRLVYVALEAPVVRKAYFVGDGQVYDSREYARIVARHIGRKPLTITLPLGFVQAVCVLLGALGKVFGFTPTLHPDKYRVLRVTNWNCETVPLAEDFDFKAEYDLNRGVEESVGWYRREKWL